ncbi:TylF/MycF/NovP-related O-methyltransferase [Streptomyces sp. NPDC096012]|uniref:TylF/MycF/NovP-related O-methyltransferase n=1 Tax=Streptomyces sp. NPDC096012 TaxID=3155684 RepID=UPI003369D266
MKRTVSNTIYEDPPVPARWAPGEQYDEINRRLGIDWPSVARTMIGLRRLDNLQESVETVLADGVPGDLIETGVWRGGACIFMRAVLMAHGVRDRSVWVADSLQGMPPAAASSHAGDRELASDRYNDLIAVTGPPCAATSRATASWTTRSRSCRDGESLPDAPIEQLAVLRLDSDLYESAEQTLEHLYPKVSPGGFVIVDDVHIPVCAAAVHDWRAAKGVSEPLHDIDGLGAYWRRDN